MPFRYQNFRKFFGRENNPFSIPLLSWGGGTLSLPHLLDGCGTFADHLRRVEFSTKEVGNPSHFCFAGDSPKVLTLKWLS